MFITLILEPITLCQSLQLVLSIHFMRKLLHTKSIKLLYNLCKLVMVDICIHYHTICHMVTSVCHGDKWLAGRRILTLVRPAEKPSCATPCPAMIGIPSQSELLRTSLSSKSSMTTSKYRLQRG